MKKFYIKKLVLLNFRNYDRLSMSFSSEKIFIHGPNGAGKTNILESLSLMFPGRGIRNADPSHLPKHGERDWSINAEIVNDQLLHTITIGKLAGKKILKIDGKSNVTSSQLTHYNNMVWISPKTDDILSASSSISRKFFDRLAYIFYKDHAQNYMIYEKAKKNRIELLKKESSPDKNWLYSLEKIMAKKSIIITKSRQKICDIVNKYNLEDTQALKKINVYMKCPICNIINENKELSDIEAILMENFDNNRSRDAISKSTNFGIHRTEFFTEDFESKITAKEASTGESKVMTISIIIAIIKAQIEINKITPIVLLDDVLSHLDSNYRERIIYAINGMDAQIWLTGTNADFSSILQCNQRGEIIPIDIENVIKKL